MFQKSLAAFFFCLGWMHFAYGVEGTCDGQVINLETAWQRTLAYAPSLDIAHTEIRIKNAEKKQASLRPNPIADLEVENIWGSGPYQGWDAAQITYSLWQTIELGGKRRARRNFAATQTGVAYWEAEITKQNLRYELVAAFIETYQYQEKLKIARERLALFEKTLGIVEAQVKAGKVSPIQRRRSQIHFKSAEVSLREAVSQLAQAKKKLSSMWGNTRPDFEALFFNFFEYESPSSLEDLAPGLFDSPDVAKSEQEIFAASYHLKLQKANRIPDVTLRGGYRQHNETDDYAFVIEAQIPIPIFNQNQGNISKARLEINQSVSKKEEILRRLREKIAIIYEQLVASFDKAELIQNSVLTEAIETLNLTQEGYQKGKLQYLDLLDAQKTLFEIQEQYLNILTVYHLKKAELQRWIGDQLCKEQDDE
ncbi:MAG: TolC family protein [Candidatus Protochlamydia sp.]|nr:TolC family protein [Candidatus Protochlamydia sp.]